MATKEQETAMSTLLVAFGIGNTVESHQQLEAMVEAVRVYDQRSQVYGQLWRQYGALSNLLSVARKTDRLMEEWWHNDGAPPVMHKDALDDAVDLLNYTVFFMRNARRMNILGTAPNRPPDRVDLMVDGSPIPIRPSPPSQHGCGCSFHVYHDNCTSDCVDRGCSYG